MRVGNSCGTITIQLRYYFIFLFLLMWYLEYHKFDLSCVFCHLLVCTYSLIVLIVLRTLHQLGMLVEDFLDMSDVILLGWCTGRKITFYGGLWLPLSHLMLAIHSLVVFPGILSLVLMCFMTLSMSTGPYSTLYLSMFFVVRKPSLLNVRLLLTIRWVVLSHFYLLLGVEMFWH